MRRLILFRHGKAETVPLTGGDRERPLTKRGKADSANTAEWLAHAGYRPDQVLVSPSIRTKATWESARGAFPDAPVEFRDRLYLAGMEQIVEELEEAPTDCDTVMVVGHNPGLQELGARLATEAGADPEQIERINDGFPTSSAVVLRVSQDGGGKGVALEAIYEPPRPGESEPRWVFVDQTPGGLG
jgi:phosphohistidine phosphatase